MRVFSQIDRLAWLAVGCASFALCSSPLLFAADSVSQPPPALTADHSLHPEWIWDPGPREANQQVVLRKTVRLPDNVRQATIEAIADAADAELQINGRRAGCLEPYQAVAQWDVTDWLRPGENELAISGRATGGPAAVALKLTWQDDQDQPQSVRTGADWQSETSPVVTYGRVGHVLWLGNREPIPLSPLEDYTQWKRALQPGQVTEPSAFVAPPGFEVQLLHAARPDEGSWVAMAFDPEGRLTVAREDQGLLRLSLDPNRSKVATVESIDQTLLECRGLLYTGGSLYANANNSKTLFRLSDTTGDGAFDQTEELYASEGGVGHGRNDLALGPDGRLYVIHGDAVDLPRHFQDRTSPARAHRRGEETREGHLLRIDRDGKQGEVLAAGLRNPFGVAINRDGEAFTYDADAEHDMGAPWYRPTRVNHLISGADFGWRGVTGTWPPYYPDHCDNAPPILDVGRGSPTAVAFATGSHFPPPYADALFILDWAYGRVAAVQMEPRGSSYACFGETFLQGRPLNVTDIAFGPDGAMYLITGGRKTQSALYRVRYTGSPPGKNAPTQQQDLRRQFAQEARGRRQRLEDLLGEQSVTVLDAAWRSLGEADPWLRYVARTVVEHQPLESWAERALQEEEPSRAAPALLALARLDASDNGPRIAQRLAELPIDSLVPREEMELLYTAWLCLEAHPNDGELHAALREGLRGRFPSRAVVGRQQQQWDLWASRILVRLDPEQAVPATVELLRQCSDQEQQMHYLFVLRSAQKGWTESARRVYFQRLQDAEYFEGGAGMPDFLTRIRNEALTALNDEEREVLADLLEPDRSDIEPTGPPRPLIRRWTLGQLESTLAEAGREGDRERGERLFVEAKCATCHRFAGRGRPLGPDLNHVARRFSRHDLLQSIIAPSDVIAENYRNVQIVTEDGQVHVGRALAAGDFREPTLRLVADLAHPEQVIEIEKQNIVESRSSPISPMPDGLLDVLSAEEVADLLTYLESGGGG